MNGSFSAFSWITKFLILVFIFAIFPITVVLIMKNYDRQARGIIELEKAQKEITTRVFEDGRVLTQAEASTLQDINEKVLGLWINDTDASSLLQMRQNNTFNEFYGDARKGYGTWRAYSAKKGQDKSGETGEGLSYHIQFIDFSKVSGGLKKNYEVRILNDANFVYVTESDDKISTFRRATTTDIQ